MVALGAAGGVFAVTRAKVLLFVTLILCWTIAGLLPSYQQTIQEKLYAQWSKTRVRIPSIKVDFHPNKDPRTAYNTSKLALLIEGRARPHLVPQILHMISTVPPDWRFLYIGSNKSIASVGRSFAIKYQQAAGKLDLMIAPKPWDIGDKENVWRMLTDTRFYDELLPGVEWILKYESDSILCSNSEQSLNDWLEWDWAGAPRTTDDRFAGNGGLSIRRVSAIKRVLSFQSRENGSQAEDEWFGSRMTLMPDLKVTNAQVETHFAVEEIFHEKPMGFHLREAVGHLPEGVWKNREQRKKILAYCPDVSIILPMKLERERCDGDNGEGIIDEAVRAAHEKAKVDAEALKAKEEAEKKSKEQAEKKAKEEAERKKKEEEGKKQVRHVPNKTS